MDNKKVDKNDYKVVEFHNSTDFDFTSDLGAMYDSNPFLVKADERRQFPYHIGNRLAVNLAKAVLVKNAPSHDPNDKNPIGKPLWDEVGLEELKNSFLTELYTEETPIAQSETDILMARVKALENLTREDKPKGDAPKEGSAKVYTDKAEVISELEARGITHDKRSKKDDLVKLLA